MRKIKFRAWDSYEKVMGEIRGILFFDDGSIGYYRDLDCTDYLPAGDDCVMQYTGLKDKNGKKIYEGDIVIMMMDKIVPKYGVCVVTWRDEYADFVLMLQQNVSKNMEKDHMGWAMCQAENSEIIGNIYENPELLKEELK